MDMDYAYYEDNDDADDDAEGEDSYDDEDEDNINNMDGAAAAAAANRQLFEDYNDGVGGNRGFNVDDDHSFASRFKEAFDVCIVPSLIQIIGYIATVLVCCLAFRLFATLLRKRYARHKHLITMLHIVSLCCGLCSLYLTMGRLTLIVISICLFNYSLLQCLRNYCRHTQRRNVGVAFTIITIGVPLIYEFFLRTPDSWQRIRGVQMVANMKIISLAFDDREAQMAAANPSTMTTKDKNNQLRLPNLIAYLGYVFCPAVCALGPWLPYTAYIQSLQLTTATTRTWLWLPHTLLNVLAAIVFLIVSNCLSPFLNTTIYKAFPLWNMPALWLHYYVDAFGVRTSHYFICFIGQACLTLAGVRLHVVADDTTTTTTATTQTTHPLFGQLITKPWCIEFPRSLSSLVRYWNIPSHNFLKKYIYNATLQYWGNNYLAATVFTYFVSSLLHGMHAGIYLVLLSLAAFAYVEVLLRARFADMFDCCIEANPCNKQRTRCTRRCCPSRLGFYDRRAWLARLINFVFSALVVFHLAYLGILLTEGENSDLRYMLLKWKRVDFLNHYIAFAAFIFYLFIS